MRLLYFASLREQLDCSAEELALPPTVGKVADLRAHLAQRGGVWGVFVTSASLRCAVNQTLAGNNTPLAEQDEVAFFPPVTGG